MDDFSAEYFGSEAQQGLQWRAEQLWSLIAQDPRFSSHGRAVALADYREDSLPAQLALARLQGVCPIEGIDSASAKIRKASLEAEDLAVDEYVSWTGDRKSFEAARTILTDRALPDDLTVVEIDPTTPPEELQKLDALTQTCDVLLPMGSFLRGWQKPSAFLYAKDSEGRVVAASAAVAQVHPDHPKSDTVWWGMLATDPARRGQRLALILGAQAMLEMNAKFGYCDFMTGVEPGHAPSAAVCTRMGLAPKGFSVIGCADPRALASGRMTK